jgi:hypothetical protein
MEEESLAVDPEKFHFHPVIDPDEIVDMSLKQVASPGQTLVEENEATGTGETLT